jgi:hypothetical protein
VVLAGCGPTKQPEEVEGTIAQPTGGQYISQASHAPPFARMQYEPFTRADAVAIAMQEWRLFGQLVDDDPPDSRPPVPDDQKPERFPGFWERVGEYWWLGQNADSRQAAWTGQHDEAGQEFDGRHDSAFAWSAAFISYVMRTAGAGPRFPYAPSHYVYINIAMQQKLGETSGWAITAERPDEYAPMPGDLICMSRLPRPLTYERLPAKHFPGHCDIVVAQQPGQISVVGGNVDDAVTMKHVPVTSDGKLAEPGDNVLDTRYPWMVVIRVQYDR